MGAVMWPLIAYVALWVLFGILISAALWEWKSEAAWPTVAFAAGFLMAAILTTFSVAFVAINAGLWLWHHVRVDVTW